MNDLDQLKELLFGAEKQALDSIAERVERREIRTADVADILPEAIHQSHGNGGDLVDSLAAPVGECLQQAVHDDPETYGNALYPVMGPAIRKSIMHALRNLSQQINEAVEHSVTPRGLKWRWEASRAGVPFGEYLLQKTMQYRVEQAYLISRENGLLISHVHHEASKIKDSDAVSAMFTAIQDFVKESFSPDRTGRLESADMGEFTLWAVHGPHALLVCVIRGVPPKGLRGDLSAILERIHFRYGDAIREYKGDTGTMVGVESDLSRCLRFEARHEKPQKSGGRLWIIPLLLLLVAAAYFVLQGRMQARELERFQQALGSADGIHVTSVERRDGGFAVRGLRDPLAVKVGDVAATVGISPADVRADLQPFQSLTPTMIELRAKRLLQPPASVQLAVTGSTLRASGTAPWAWHEQLENRFGAIAGIESLDVAGLEISGRVTLEQRVAQLDGKRFYFESGTQLTPESDAALSLQAAAIDEIADDAAGAGLQVSLLIVGSTDSIGNEAMNEQLARRRVGIAENALQSAGVDIVPETRLEYPDAGERPRVEIERRFVQMNVTLLDPAPRQ